MYINFDCMVLSPLNIPHIRETHNRLIPVMGDSIILVNIALMFVQGVMFETPESLTSQIETMVESLSSDMLYMYVSGQTALLPQAKNKIREDIHEFIAGSVNYFQSQPFVLSLLSAAFAQNLYVRANDVVDDITQPYINVTVKPRFSPCNPQIS